MREECCSHFPLAEGTLIASAIGQRPTSRISLAGDRDSNSSSMRAFIAIDVRDEIRKQLAETQRRLRPAAPDAKWSRPEGFHLTLKFLGEISDAQITKVTGALTALGSFKPFPIEVKGFGFFPQPHKPRVFWAGVQAPPSLANLADTIQKAMES